MSWFYNREFSGDNEIITFLGCKFVRKSQLAERLNFLMKSNDQLQFFLKTFCDVSQCKPAKGNMRKLQLLRSNALHLVIKILEKNNLTYWLDFGTLLGAYRHKGFIPWDDDIDIAMPREDYEKAREVLERELEGTGLRIEVGGINRSFLLRMLDKDSDFYYVDIFPYDFIQGVYDDKKILAEKLNSVSKKMIFDSGYFDKYQKNPVDIRTTRDGILEECKNKGIKIVNDGDTLVRGVESQPFNSKQSIHDKENVFPLQEITFEDFKAKAPNNIVEYLANCDEGIYGNIMMFPSPSQWSRHPLTRKLNDLNLVRFIDEKAQLLANLLAKY